ncbi:MAG: hypothetical protein ACLQJL_09695, partial [Roseiarcus sp.]
VIEKHVMYGVKVSVNYDIHEKYLGFISQQSLKNPYYLSVYSMILALTSDDGLYALHGPIDFIFDCQQGLAGFVQDAWPFIQKFLPDRNSSRLGRLPQFDNDKHALPLQAADFHAWVVRRWLEDEEIGRPLYPPIWRPTRDIDVLSVGVGEQQLAEFAAAIHAAGIDSLD